MRLLWMVVLSAGLVWAAGCSSSTTPPVDGGQDGQVDGDDGGQDGQDGGDLDGADGGDGALQPAGPTRFTPTSGSGTAESEGHRARLRVGAPQQLGGGGP
jgi:hypothetical protein